VRYLLTILAVLAVVGGLVAIKASQIGSLIAMGEEFEKSGPPPEPVGSHKADQQSWESVIEAIGSIASAKGVAITTEVPGTVTKIRFDSGDVVKVGQVLVQLDTSVEQAQLASAIARRDLATTNLKRTKALVERGVAAVATLDNEDSALKSAAADVAALQAQIARKTIRAPFAGKLGIRTVDQGQFLNPGTPLTTLESIDAVYVDFTLPQQRLAEVRAGMPVRLQVEGNEGPALEGSIAAIDPSIDPSTRSIKLRAAMPAKSDALRPGMFVDVQVLLPEKKSFVVVPITALVRAPYGDSVFIVEDKPADAPGTRETPDGKPVKVARQQFVRTGPQRGDFVAVLEGLEAGKEIVTTGAFKLRNGAPIYITDEAIPQPSLDPKPENR
jgi:membrane fusion protein (multidrug efflux system)